MPRLPRPGLGLPRSTPADHPRCCDQSRFLEKQQQCRRKYQIKGRKQKPPKPQGLSILLSHQISQPYGLVPASVSRETPQTKSPHSIRALGGTWSDEKLSVKSSLAYQWNFLTETLPGHQCENSQSNSIRNVNTVHTITTPKPAHFNPKHTPRPTV